MGLKKYKCENCGENFSSYFDNAKFCCKNCMKQYRKKHSKLSNRVCPICGKKFNAHDDKSIHCSKECARKSRMNRCVCVCDYCGVEFSRIKSEVDKNKRHYCSNDCRKLGHYWGNDDLFFLANNYGLITNKELGNLLNHKRSAAEVKRKAIELKLTKSNKWTDDEANLLKEVYSALPMQAVLQKFPNKTKTSIMSKAHSLRLTTLFYNDRIYSENEDKFIVDNFRKISELEIAKQLNRSYSSVISRVGKLGLAKLYPRETKYTDIKEYIRKHTKSWRNRIISLNGGKCQLTGSSQNIVLHHIRGFNLLVEELSQLLDLDDSKPINDYTNEELDFIVEQFLILQDSYREYICITEEIHKKFHEIYGYGYNTKEQWQLFVDNNQYKSLIA